MTHSNDVQCRPVRLDQYVNQDPQLTFKTRLVFKARRLLVQLCQTPSLYSRPGLYLRPGFYSRKYDISASLLPSLCATMNTANMHLVFSQLLLRIVIETDDK